jgi:hypothetical protein
MSRSIAILLCGCGLTAAEQPGLSVVLREFSYSQRVEFVQGNGDHPFADEDQRRAQLVLELHGDGALALLGWQALSVQAVSDRGEALALTGVPSEGVITATHDLKTDPSVALPGLALPLTQQPLRGLRRLHGSLAVRFSREPAQGERLAFTSLVPNQDHPVPGLEAGTMALTDRNDGRLVFRLDPVAFLAVQDVVFLSAEGKPITTRNRRAEWRDDQGQLSYNLKTSQIAMVEVLSYRRIECQQVACDWTDLVLGMVVPGREDLRGVTVRGAEEF